MRRRNVPWERAGLIPFGKKPIVSMFAALGLMLAPATTWAQTPPKGEPGAPPEATKPPSESTVPRQVPGDRTPDPRQPLTEQLKEGDGVLEPPRAVDPGITQPVPDEFESKTPVIKPPRDADTDADKEGADKPKPEPAPPAPK